MPNPARPDIAFVGPWLVVLVFYLVSPQTLLNPPFAPSVAIMLGFNLLSAPFIFWFIKRLVEHRHGPMEVKRPSLTNRQVLIFSRFLALVMMSWIAAEVVNIIYSGGLPLIWSLTGSDKGYADFGLPSIGGLANMLRCFAVIASIVLFVVTRRLRYLLLWVTLFLSVILELSRSGIFMLLCYSASSAFLLVNFRLRHLLVTIAFIVLAITAFLGIGALRQIAASGSDVGADAFSGLPVGAYWIWSYLVSPLGNLNHAATLGIAPSGLPLFTLQSAVPSAINFLFFTAAYPIPLIVPSLNATSMYAPLVADFGFVGATIFMSVFQVIASYVYVAARRGSVFYLCVYPALFASLVLSIFYIYVMTLGVLLLPLVCGALVRFVQKREVVGSGLMLNLPPNLQV